MAQWNNCRLSLRGEKMSTKPGHLLLKFFATTLFWIFSSCLGVWVKKSKKDIVSIVERSCRADKKTSSIESAMHNFIKEKFRGILG